MDENKPNIADFAFLIETISKNENQNIAKYCRQAIENAARKKKFPKLNAPIKSAEGNQIGSIQFYDNSRYYILSILRDQVDKPSQNDYYLEKDGMTIYMSKIQTSPGYKAENHKLERRVGETAKETFRAADGYSLFTNNEKDSVKEIMYHTTPLLNMALDSRGYYKFEGKAAAGTVFEGVCKNSGGISYALSLIPNTSRDNCPLVLSVENGKATISFCLPHGMEGSLEDYKERYSPDLEAVKSKITILGSMGIDLEDIPAALKPTSYGQK